MRIRVFTPSIEKVSENCPNLCVCCTISPQIAATLKARGWRSRVHLKPRAPVSSQKQFRREVTMSEKLAKMLTLEKLSGYWSKIERFSVRSWHSNRSLTLLVLFSLACLIVSTLGLALDPRLINGEHAWIKPCKFSTSLAVYGLTLIWFSHYLTKHKIFFRWTCRAALAGTVVELLAIIVQVVRGTTSHFNHATSFDHMMYATITAAITPVAFGVIALFVMLLREERLPSVLGLSLRWGVFLTIVGLIPGVLMVLPDSVHDLILCCQQFDGHSVGTSSSTLTGGGPGLPFLGWSTVAGDLRVAHFAGIHGLQVLPFVGLLIDRLGSRLSTLKQQLLVWNAGLLYLGSILVLTWQALCTESVAAPSPRTILVALVLLSLSTLGVALTIWLPRLSPRVLTPIMVEESFDQQRVTLTLRG